MKVSRSSRSPLRFLSLNSTLRKPRWLASSLFIARFTQKLLPKEIDSALKLLATPRTAELTKFPNPRYFWVLELLAQLGYIGLNHCCGQNILHITQMGCKTINFGRFRGNTANKGFCRVRIDLQNAVVILGLCSATLQKKLAAAVNVPCESGAIWLRSKTITPKQPNILWGTFYYSNGNGNKFRPTTLHNNSGK